MPLRDHFHMPLRGLCTWESFHSGWAYEIMRQLNRSMPAGYVARPNVKLGVDVQADVAALEKPEHEPLEDGGVATAVWAPATPTLAVAVDFHRLDVFEVQVHREGGLELVAAVELVSPRNKDRPSARRSFAAKCAAYLQAGVSLLIVDVVTERRDNLYTELLEQMLLTPESNGHGDLYAVACRTVPPRQPGVLETWVTHLAVGAELPTLPLWLEMDLAIPLDLAVSYGATFVELRVPV